MNRSQTTVVLGQEYDRELHAALLGALRELGAVKIDRSWGVAGSQEVTTLDVNLNGHVVTVTSETYVGLSITADPQISEQIVELLRQRGFPVPTSPES